MVREAQILMDRKLYLELCQKVSLLKDGVCGIKKNIPNELKVIHNNIIYYPISYELSFKNGNVKHIAILHDVKSNSIIKCNLAKVDIFENV